METNRWSYDLEGVEKYASCLSPDFDRLPPEQIYKEYEMEVPEEVLEFCRIIEGLGGRVLLVGGCVRDAILSMEKGRGKIQPKDIDMEVYGIYPEDLLNEVDKHFGLEKSGTYGKQFEIIKIFGRGRTYDLDISIPRADNKTGSGSRGFETTSHPEFNVTEAARRRDLTCNSVSYDPLKKVVFDPYSGVNDIKENVIRVTDPEKFTEDPVRILRIMQFVARFGAKIAPETEELCERMMNKEKASQERNKKILIGGTEDDTELAMKLMSKSAVELDDESNNRIFDEFKKLLLKGKKPSLGLEFARRIGVIDRYYPWLAELTVTEQEFKWHPEGSAWNHSLQVVDAAVEIARRENLNGDETLELVAAALSHDLGKPTKTSKEWKEVDGVMKEVITSNGHDMEGGWLSSEFINAFAPTAKVKIERNEDGDYVGLEETDFQKELKQKVKILTEKHMQLKAWYLLYKEEEKINPEKAKRQARKWLGGLARKLAENGTNIYMLSYVTESDQRGRNGESNIPLKREDVEDLVEWQTWLNEMMKEVKIEKKLPDKLIGGKMITKETGLPEGVELGVVVSWVFDDQLAGEFTSIEDGLARANIYAEIVKQCLQVAREENWKTVAVNGKKKLPRIQDEVCNWLRQDGIKEKVMANAQLSILEKIVEKEADRVAELGEWPKHIKSGSLIDRVPKGNREQAPGFDAGVACALDLIPRDKQELAARLHANYSVESIEQIREELKQDDPDSPTTWWLAACAICKEGEINAEGFLQQVEDFKELAKDPEKRLAAAKSEFEKMKSSFVIKDGIPFGTKDGCMQAAYIAGWPVAATYAEKYGVFFVGTYLPTLGLENFVWSKEVDENGNRKSGPVYGSKQFVKCANEEEYNKVIAIVKKKLLA